MKLKLRLCYKVCLIVHLFVAGVVIAAIIFPVLDVFCKPDDAKRKHGALKLAWLRWFSGILDLEVSKVGNPSGKASLMVSNHISWLDIIVLGSFSSAHFVAKSDILAWPIIGYLAKRGGTVFVRRGDKQQARAIAEEIIWLLKQNGTVIAFPEGTTTKGDEVLPFHASLFQSAVLAKAPVQPVAMNYLGETKQYAPFVGEDAFIPHLIKMLSLDKIEVSVDFLPCIDMSGKNRHSVSNEARALIMESITGKQEKIVISKVGYGN
ncbi:lysophospholipid acyltransferase family protein [Methyloglobulus sp.]|uniref:lysophospholipid acyltransferase family protein n=1 Tax=Methyloglobulus sp. TaxID=2518622 RepID=UPI0032B7C111